MAIDKEELIKTIHAKRGNVRNVAKAFGVSYETIYTYLRSDPELREAKAQYARSPYGAITFERPVLERFRLLSSQRPKGDTHTIFLSELLDGYVQRQTD